MTCGHCDVNQAATGSLANTATASGGGGTEATPGNNSATDTGHRLDPSADVAVTKTDGVPSIIPGGTTTYIVVLSNAGPSASANVTLADTIPAAFTSC